MPSRAPTVERVAEESAACASPDAIQDTTVAEESGARSHQAVNDVRALAMKRASPKGTMSTLANRTMAFSAFMISELTFLTYLASLLMRAT